MRVWIRIRDERGLELTVATELSKLELWEIDECGEILMRKLKLEPVKAKAKAASA